MAGIKVDENEGDPGKKEKGKEYPQEIPADEAAPAFPLASLTPYFRQSGVSLAGDQNGLPGYSVGD